MGVALISLAFTEKFTNPAMATHTLEEYPELNVFSLVGIAVDPQTFIAVAGATELLFGLLVISGAFPQVAALIAVVPFNATLVLFGQTEMVGHLPVYGVFLALLAYGSNRETAVLVRWLPSLRRSQRLEGSPRGRGRTGVRVSVSPLGYPAYTGSSRTPDGPTRGVTGGDV